MWPLNERPFFNFKPADRAVAYRITPTIIPIANEPIKVKIISAGMAAIAALTIKFTIDKKGISISTTVISFLLFYIFSNFD